MMGQPDGELKSVLVTHSEGGFSERRTLPVAVADLQKRVACVSNALGSLEDKLGPILMDSEPPSKEPVSVEQHLAGASVLRDEVGPLCVAMDKLECRIAELIARLDV